MSTERESDEWLYGSPRDWYLPTRARPGTAHHFPVKGAPSSCRRYAYAERGKPLGPYIYAFCKACEARGGSS